MELQPLTLTVAGFVSCGTQYLLDFLLKKFDVEIKMAGIVESVIISFVVAIVFSIATGQFSFGSLDAVCASLVGAWLLGQGVYNVSEQIKKKIEARKASN